MYLGTFWNVLGHFRKIFFFTNSETFYKYLRLSQEEVSKMFSNVLEHLGNFSNILENFFSLAHHTEAKNGYKAVVKIIKSSKSKYEQMITNKGI